jgi:dTDP-4-amino-4,6-dideoxygalactose transaminase
MNKFIPLVDLKAEYEFLKEELLEKIQQTLVSDSFILGKELEEFERRFAEYIGTGYCVGVASGTDALYLSLKALDLEAGSEVITPSFTFIATVLSIVNAGLKPVLVDISAENYCIDVSELEKKITKKTKVILPVHLFGYPAKLDRIVSICEERKIYLIEDACQAHGSKYRNRKLGSFGTAGCFSFYPSKNLGCYGDGGAVTTNDENIYQKLKYLRNYGQTSKYEHTYFGINSRLDTIQAGILNVKLKYLDEWNSKRREKALLYKKLLRNLPIILPPDDTQDTYQIYHVFAIRTKKRDQLFEHLQKHNISTVIHYPKPIHLQNSFRAFFKGQHFPVSEEVAKEILSLPLHPFLSEEDIEYISSVIKSFFV